MSLVMQIKFPIEQGEDDKRLLLGLIETALGLYKDTLKSDIDERMQRQFEFQVRAGNALYAQILNNRSAPDGIVLHLERGDEERYLLLNMIHLALKQYDEVTAALPVGTTRDVFMRKVQRGNELYTLIEDAGAPS